MTGRAGDDEQAALRRIALRCELAKKHLGRIEELAKRMLADQCHDWDHWLRDGEELDGACSQLRDEVEELGWDWENTSYAVLAAAQDELDTEASRGPDAGSSDEVLQFPGS